MGLPFKIIIIFLILIPGTLLATDLKFDSTEEEETPPEPVEVSPVQSHGEILFFPDRVERPSDDRHKVKGGDVVPICLKLEPLESQFLQTLKKKAIGFRLILEDNAEPPNVITVTVDNYEQSLKEGEKGCYPGEFEVPKVTASGVYQVSDLLLHHQSDNYYSLRDYLYGFSQADELEIENASVDSESPKLVEIYSKDPEQRRMTRHPKTLLIQVRQNFYFQDDLSGLDPKSLKVFYRLSEDGFPVGFYESSCRRKSKKKGKFSCKLKLIRPKPIWNLREVDLELSNIYIKDNSGNQIAFSDAKLFKEKSQGTPIQFFFSGYPKEKSGIATNRSYQRYSPE